MSQTPVEHPLKKPRPSVSEIKSYTSTRDSSIRSTFKEAILSGYAPDGGLFVPLGEVPFWSRDELAELAALPTYGALAFAVLRRFVPAAEVSDDALAAVLAQAYGAFDDPDHAVVVRRLEGGSSGGGGLYVSELFHGPTQCFKDLGLGVVVAFLDHFTPRGSTAPATAPAAAPAAGAASAPMGAEGASPLPPPLPPPKAAPATVRRTLVVSTTGDTGPAAVHAVVRAANPNLNIVVTYPKGQISEYQRKQMTTVVSPNVKVVEFEGGGDDMDACIKAMQRDVAFKTAHGLCGINSYNVGRPLAQIVHYFWTVFRVAELEGADLRSPTSFGGVNLAIPTGAMGNLVAAQLARLAGLPLGTTAACVNANDVTHRAFATGAYHVRAQAGGMRRTLSDAINILCPYNMERALYYLTARDAPTVQAWYATLETTGALDLPPPWVAALKARCGFASARVDDDGTKAEMARLASPPSPPADTPAEAEADTDTPQRPRNGGGGGYGYVACPHSCVAFAGARALGLFPHAQGGTKEEEGGGGGGTPCCVLATASPCKFQESVTAGLGPEGWAAYAASPAFPDAARAVLARAEVPPLRFAAVGGDGALGESQEAWEQEMRKIIAGFTERE